MTLASPLAPPVPQRAGERQTWTGLHGAAGALALASAATRRSGTLLAIAPDTQSAYRLQSELEFFLEDGDIAVFGFPDWETLAYDSFSPHEDIISQRLLALAQLPETRQAVLVVPVSTLMQRVAPRDYLLGSSLLVKVGDRLDVSSRRRQLEAAGYHRVETVEEHGEFAVRGSLLDIFPMGAEFPYRIDLFDDEVDQLRIFHPDSQRTIEKVDSVELLPAKEFPLDSNAITRFRSRWHETFDVDVRQCPVYQDVSAAIASPGVEYFLPFFFDSLATLFDYLPEDTLVATYGDVDQSATHFRAEVHDRYENLRYDIERPILPPKSLFLEPEEVNQHIKRYPRVSVESETLPRAPHRRAFASRRLPDIAAEARSKRPTDKLEAFLDETPDLRVLFCAETPGRREVLLELLLGADIRPREFDRWSSFVGSDERLGITTVPLESALWLETEGVVLITETQLFGHRVTQRDRRARLEESPDQIIRNLTELRAGAPVVHIEHGVGRYRGLEILTVDGEQGEFLTIDYAEETRLYVPVASLHLISRYTGGDAETAPLHKLGSDQWAKAKRKAAEKARDVAAELLNIYARREARTGFRFDPPDADYHRFVSQFAFEATPDQDKSVQAVVEDMSSENAMDRLICGDVGFGKTEVAMRAAFLAVESGKQVAVLVPTTLLAQQHLETFQDRFAPWPVRIDLMSRFRTAKDVESVSELLRTGKVDIVIATHKLLYQDLDFENLGLLIIDEEHRFGVRQKERLKSLRSEVDILTLTATQIPRTLNLAMSGLRDMSIIATPPARRLSINTFVRQYQRGIIKEAILRELRRGGQVYYLHNQIRNIEEVAQRIHELVPEASIAIGHGQMPERTLERVMSDFYHGRTQILVCTTSIETGIDVPNANTIIIDRADRVGLAQLHQLRGRVGRSPHQASAYLLTPHPKAVTTDAVKRLEAIEAARELGIGFTLATHDLESRGAGELLGEEQTGHIQTVGFSLYMEMLERAVSAIRAGKTPNLDSPLDAGVEVNLRVPALIPDDYLPDIHMRLIIYKRIANAASLEELEDLRAEMRDRFGRLPVQLETLFKVTEIKIAASRLGIDRIDAGPKGVRMYFAHETRVDPLHLVKLVQARPNEYRLEGGTRLRVEHVLADPGERFAYVNELLEELSPDQDDRSTAMTAAGD